MTSPDRCGRNISTVIPHRHDKHSLACNNDNPDSWADGWTRQPPVYSGARSLLKRNTPARTRTAPIVTSRPALPLSIVTATKYEPEPNTPIYDTNDP
jgi:hypothetical protein